MFSIYSYSYWLEGWAQWRRLHRARGHAPPTLQMSVHGGAPRVEKQPTKNHQTVLTITKALTKTSIIILLGPKKWRDTTEKNFWIGAPTFAPDRCPHFQIRSGATGWAPSRTYLPLTPWKHPPVHNPDYLFVPQSWTEIGALDKQWTSVRRTEHSTAWNEESTKKTNFFVAWKSPSVSPRGRMKDLYWFFRQCQCVTLLEQTSLCVTYCVTSLICKGGATSLLLYSLAVTWLESPRAPRTMFAARRLLWKQLVSEVGTREQMCLEHVFERW